MVDYSQKFWEERSKAESSASLTSSATDPSNSGGSTSSAASITQALPQARGAGELLIGDACLSQLANCQ